jgi:hypothetical protein
MESERTRKRERRDDGVRVRRGSGKGAGDEEHGEDAWDEEGEFDETTVEKSEGRIMMSG